MYIINIFDPKTWDIWVMGTPLTASRIPVYTAKATSIQEHADMAFNLALFNLGDKKTVDTYLVANGQRIGWGEPPTVNVSNGIVGGYKTMLGGSRTRNAFGLLNDGRYFTAQTSHKVSEKLFKSNVISRIKSLYGAAVSVFLYEDGGGSTQQYSARSKLNFAPEGGRAVPTCLCVRARKPLVITRNLYKGCKGEDVRLLQQVLGGIEVDGVYGNGTANRVRQAQKALGIKADGMAGKGQTLPALGFKTAL